MRENVLKDKMFWLLLIFASVYILGNIGTGSLSTWDEALYANISRNIVKTAGWSVMHQAGAKPWFDKPPLYMWCTAVFYKILGVNEFSTRLTSGLFSIATVALLYAFMKSMSDKVTALLSGLILLAFPHYIHFSKLGMMDVPVTFFTVLTVYLFWLGREEEECLFYSGAVVGLAYLMKGFAGFLGPIIIVFYSVFSKHIRLLLKRQFLLGIALSFSVIFLWHLTQFISAGPAALKGYFDFHIYQRAASALEGHGGGINFYPRAVFNKNIPWSVLIYGSVIYITWKSIKFKNKDALLILSWILATFLLYTLVRTKLNWYIMPAYPALAMSSALFLAEFLKKKMLYIALAVILLGMLVQAPLSWAFKLDFTPDIKKVAVLAEELCRQGNDIYMIGGNDSEIFYYDFTKELNKGVYRSLLMQGKKNIYCIILPDLFEEKKADYNFDYTPVYESRRTSLYKLTFKDIK